MRRNRTVVVVLAVICLLGGATAAKATWGIKWIVDGCFLPSMKPGDPYCAGPAYESDFIGDLDGNGIPEIIVLGPTYDGILSILDGRTGAMMFSTTNPWGAPIEQVKLADADGDGLPDAIATIFYGNPNVRKVIVVGWGGVNAVQDDPSTLGNYHSDLKQNAPNPFNPQTKIEFSLAAPGVVRLQVFDVGGRLVRTLADGRFDGGDHSLIWNGKNESGIAVSSGTYFYRLDVDGKVIGTEKAVMLE
jgi:hypothetical protein